MTTTPKLGLPYPEDTGYVINGDDDIEALANAIEARLTAPGVLQVEMANVGAALGAGPQAVPFPGSVSLIDGFTFDGTVTYTGKTRFFMVAATVNIQTGAPLEAVSSFVECRLNHVTTAVWGSYDQVVSTTTGSKLDREVVHNLAFPIRLASGNTLEFVAGASPAATLGLTALRVMPMGPELIA